MVRTLGACSAVLLLATPVFAQQVDEEDAALMEELGVEFLFEGEEYSLEDIRKKHPTIKPTIPMDPDDPIYDVWKLIRSNLAEGR